jgi:hypothetical protein
MHYKATLYMGFAKGWTGEVETAEVGKNGRSRVGPSIAKLS